jgi:SNF family Na+-dependent transporter
VAMLIKLFSLFIFFIEAIIMIWEIILNRKMRKYKIEGFEKISEEERRSRYSKKFAGCGCLTFVLYFAILVIGMFGFESRNELMKSMLIEA